MNIVLNRIDDRLIHGQLLASWTKKLSAKRIVVIDDQLAGDKFSEQIFLLSVPSHIDIKIFGVSQGAAYLLANNDKMGINTIVLLRMPKTARDLWELGYHPDELNIGSMSATASRHALKSNLYIADEEIDILKGLMEAGTRVFVQVVYAENRIDFKELISNSGKI